MNCVYHQITLANTRCHTCAKPLCPACDHRVKGYTYCQDCIVAGVEKLRAGSQLPPSSLSKSPFAAAFMGLIPGLGSVYNGLVIRALVHFSMVAGLWQLDDIFDASLFWWAGTAFYAYSIFNAYQNAKRINAGEDLSGEEESLKNQMREKTKIWGSAVIGIGILTLLHWLLPHSFVDKLWPLLFIGFGVYLITTYQKKTKAKKTNPFTQDVRPEIPSVVTFDSLAHDYTQAETRRFDVR